MGDRHTTEHVPLIGFSAVALRKTVVAIRHIIGHKARLHADYVQE